MAEKDWTGLVAKLLAKAQDSATTEAERLALMDKAYVLMSTHGIKQDMFAAASGSTEDIIRKDISLKGPHYEPRSILARGAAKLFGCRTVRMISEKRMAIFGTQRDIDSMITLLVSLYVQLLTGLEAAKRTKPVDVHGRTFNNSWSIGFADGAYERIVAAYEHAKEAVQAETTGNGMELVLMDKARRTALAVQNDFPRLASPRMPNVTHQGSFLSGQIAGRKADIGQSRVGNTGHGRIAIGN